MVGRFESEMEESCTCTVQTPGELSLFVKKVLFSGILLPFAFVFRFQRTLNVTSHTIYMPINLVFSQNKLTTGSCEKNEAE